MFFSPFSLTSKLHVQLNDHQFDLGTHWQMHQKPHIDNCNHKFTQLKVVVLRSFKYLPSELELVKIVLLKAVILERLVLIPPKIIGLCKLMRQNMKIFFGFWMTSKNAMVILHENYVEKCSVNPTHPKCWIYTNEN